MLLELIVISSMDGCLICFLCITELLTAISVCDFFFFLSAESSNSKLTNVFKK